MAIANKHHSSMRVAVVSASRIQRESLRTLIEDNGPRVVSAATLQDYLSNQEALNPDVLLIDLEHATDSELERVSDFVATSMIPVLFNESPTIPTMPGPYRDDWANNLIGKLVDLTERGAHPSPRGLLSRPRYVQSSTYRLPKVLVLSRSKTRRRVLELILINQGFQETNEAYFDLRYAAPRDGAVDVIVVDEHNVGPDEQDAFDAIVAQDKVPVYRCNSSQVPTSAGERRVWGQKFAGQLIQLHKKRHALPDVSRTTSTILSAPGGAFSAPHDEDTASDQWGDRMAQKLAKLRMSIKSNHDDFMSDIATATTDTATKSPSVADTQIDQPEPKKTVSIADQVSAHIEEAQHESALMQQRIEQELQRDMKYRRPETAAAPRNAGNPDDTKPQPKAKPAVSRTPELKIVDASNLDDVPRTRHPGEHPANAKPSESFQNEQIARFFDLNEQMTRVDEARTAKIKKDASKFSFDHLAVAQDAGIGNPFAKKPAPKKASPGGPGSKPKTPVKPYRSKTTLARLINTLHDVKKLIPKIFN
jgi:hypothetical protein